MINVTIKFLLIALRIIAAYDIFAVIWQTVKNGKFGIVTITSILRRWFGNDPDWKQKGRPIVPFAIGLIFIGHIGVYRWNNLLQSKISIWIFIVLSIIAIILQIIGAIKKEKGKVYLFMCRFWPIPMTIGILVGSFWK